MYRISEIISNLYDTRQQLYSSPVLHFWSDFYCHKHVSNSHIKWDIILLIRNVVYA